MKDFEMWNLFNKNKRLPDIYDAWQFGEKVDCLADLVIRGENTATSSLFQSYKLENVEIPKVGDYSVILDSSNNAVCIVRNTSVNIYKFGEVPEIIAYKEGEGDKTLNYWRKVHKSIFSNILGNSFNNDTLIVCEEFEVVFK